MTMGNAKNMQVGDTANHRKPVGELSYTMTKGMISALDRDNTGDAYSSTTLNMFQFDAAVNAGNSGGTSITTEDRSSAWSPRNRLHGR